MVQSGKATYIQDLGTTGTCAWCAYEDLIGIILLESTSAVCNRVPKPRITADQYQSGSAIRFVGHPSIVRSIAVTRPNCHSTLVPDLQNPASVLRSFITQYCKSNTMTQTMPLETSLPGLNLELELLNLLSNLWFDLIPIFKK